MGLLEDRCVSETVARGFCCDTVSVETARGLNRYWHAGMNPHHTAQLQQSALVDLYDHFRTPQAR
jgi:hypothetical protein